MIDILVELNWLAIGLATLASFILGALWFTPLFGKAYDNASGYQRKKGQTFTTIYYVGPFVGSLVMAIAMAILLTSLSPDDLTDAMMLSLVVGLGVAASASVVNAINPKIAHPLQYGVVTGGYHVVSLLVITAILFWL